MRPGRSAAWLVALSLLAPLAACGRNREAAPQAAPKTALSGQAIAAAIAAPPVPPPPGSAPTAPEAPKTPAMVSGAARSVAVSNDRFAFAYAYPATAGSLPALRLTLDAELQAMQATLARDAAAGAQAAKTNDFPYNAYETRKSWQVVTDLPDWLSLSAELYTYSGGAHGMTSFDALVWDKRAGVRRAPIDLFASKAALRAATKAPFCAALKRERAKRRAGETLGDAVPEFSQCLDPTASVVILGSSDHRAFNRIGFLIEPYAAGPYAEGSYEITLPATPAVLAAVKPKYAAAFAAR